MKRYALIITEGPHDQASIGKILEHHGFKKFNGRMEQLAPEWKELVDKPSTSNPLYKRLSAPSVFEHELLSVGVHQVGGSTNIVKAVQLLRLLESKSVLLDSFGIVLDLDKESTDKLGESLQKAFSAVVSHFPKKLGMVAKESPRCGAYGLPDNESNGVLESILIECAKLVYPCLHSESEAFLNAVEKTCNHKFKNFDREKALVATIGSVLHPGKTNTVTIADGDWISALSLSNVRQLQNLESFLKELIQW